MFNFFSLKDKKTLNKKKKKQARCLGLLAKARPNKKISNLAHLGILSSIFLRKLGRQHIVHLVFVLKK